MIFFQSEQSKLSKSWIYVVIDDESKRLIVILPNELH